MLEYNETQIRDMFEFLERDSEFNKHDKPFYDSLAKEYHILVGGQTGSGKSVILNGFICNLLKTRKIGTYGIILCDPKRVEFSRYNTRKSRKTWLIDYCNNKSDIMDILQVLEREMDRRYKKMERQKIDKYKGREIYCIIDEIADLMTDSNKTIVKEFTRILQRLLQLARASGIHIICATQQLKAVVLPTVLTCNFTAIVGLKTRTATESRLIIGESILTTLPKYGECYYLGSDGMQHIKDIPYLTSEDINNIVNNI